MLNREEVRSKVFELASDVFDIDPGDITENKDIVDDFQASSVVRLEYLVMIERQFGFKFDIARVEETGRFGELIDLIMGQLAGRSP